MNKSKIFFFQLFLLCTIATMGQSTLREYNLCVQNWRVWLDEKATWKDDTLYLPNEVDLQYIKANAPGCGWKDIYQTGMISNLPVCVEELFSNGKPDWTYHGVSWFTTQFEVPNDWKEKVVRLTIGKKNLRLEIYINEKLAGYDIIGGTPYTCDISSFLVPGTINRIAFRITNPGGQRGWNDFPLITWRKYKFPPHRDFGGIGGEVTFLVTDKIYVRDVSVKNLLPAKANNIEVQTCIVNKTDHTTPLTVSVRVFSEKNKSKVLEKVFDLSIEKQTATTVKRIFQVPDAELWSVDHPNLYQCEITVESAHTRDQAQQSFGFRVFEVRVNEKGEENYYLNGDRFRHKSAIDWGYYAHHGYYPNAEMARKSVEAAKAIGHNGINCHRNMGDYLLLKNADELGLVIFEEPGGFDETIKLYSEANSKCIKTFEGQVMEERCLRMVRRDCSHPSVVGYIMSNERDIFDLLRKNVMLDMHQVDDSKLIVNQSGGVPGGPSGQIPHLRPYDKKFRLDYMDDHTVFSESRFMEYEFNSHHSANDTAKYGIFGRIDPLSGDNIVYWGEVRCYAGPDNWYRVDQQRNELAASRFGYDAQAFRPLAQKIEAYFKQNNLPQTGSKNIHSPADVSLQAGRGLMYTDGRLDQIILSNNSVDGFAINGWSGGTSGIPKEHGEGMEWYSAIVDEGRNLKGPSADYQFWNRPLQVAIFRKNGKYFNPGDSVNVDVHLINEGKLAPGDYTLIMKVKDGDGRETGFSRRIPLRVEGGDTYAQLIIEDLTIKIEPDWKAGYITLEGLLFKNGEKVASGAEQVLLKNRASYQKELAGKHMTVLDWPAACEALQQAGVTCNNNELSNTILAAGIPSTEMLQTLLEQTRNGATFILRFDEKWAEVLYKEGILKEKVTQWGGKQQPYWIGNGWGYLDYFIGNQAIPGGCTIGTNSWEVPSDPRGFYPFVSNYPQQAYGAWLARPDTLLVLLGEINFGKGKILLAPSYPVDANEAFNDLLFFNLVK